MEFETDQIKAITANLRVGTEDDKEFERLLKVADTALKEKRLNLDAAKAIS